MQTNTEKVGLTQLLARFNELVEKHREHGAGDTEPDWVFQELLWAAVSGEQPVAPTDARSWNLYTHHTVPRTQTAEERDVAVQNVLEKITAVDAAAKELGDLSQTIIDYIEDCPIRRLATLKEHLKGVCWRVNT